MEPNRPTSSNPSSADSKDVKIIQWEDFEQELARLWSLSSALNEAKEKKSSLNAKLESLIQVQSESLSRSNKLDEMQEKLEARKSVMESMLTKSKIASENSRKQEEQLSDDVQSLLVAGSNLCVAKKKFQEGDTRHSEERENEHLRELQRTLRKRQQYMVSVISFLYPVKASIAPGHELELESFTRGSRLGNSSKLKPLYDDGTLSISGLQLTMLPFAKMGFFSDKKVVQRSATALGYVAHVVCLIASYLEIPLRYPLRLGGSHSYIKDPAPSIEANSNGSASNILLATEFKSVEFPLFLEGQDATRAAYAVFLLNKDGVATHFKIRRNSQIKKLLLAYCEKKVLEYKTMRFLLDEKRVNPSKTPDQLGLRDGDQIDAFQDQSGGGILKYYR